MAETALNETGEYGHGAVPLAAPPPLLRTPAVPCATSQDMVPPVARDAEPVRQLARAWLTALAASGDGQAPDPRTMPMDPAGARRFLTEQSAALVSILLGSPFRPWQAAAIGHALVNTDFVSADVLGRSLRVLLLRLPEMAAGCPRLTEALGDLDHRVAAVAEALANGYVRALRDRTLAEQESIRQAELEAQRTISEELRHQATHDPLTGLANRAAALGRLSAAIRAGGDTRIGLCYLDLDGFKAVNDRYGHDAGDELLVIVSGRIGKVATEHGALAARIGGDEFVVLAESSPGAAGMISLAARILAEVRRPVALRIGRVCVSACVGIADRAVSSPGAATIVADADAALYEAKSRGPGRWAVYDPARRQAS